MKNIKYLAIMALGLVACEPELDNSVNDSGAYSSGTADFSKFVTIGNSLTAGYADGTVYLEGQKNSYPNILAEKFSFVGGGEFTQPLVNDNIGGLTMGGGAALPGFDPRFVLTGNPLGPARLTDVPTTDVSNILTGPFNNVGVPGAKSFHLLSNSYGDISGLATGTANPYFVRMASSSSATMLGDAMAQDATFFSLWIGNNDILSFATAGGDGVDQTGNYDATTYGFNDITDPLVFHGTYDALLNGMTANGAKGVVMNIPTVTSIPYFTTVPHAPLSPANPDFGPMIPALNAQFGLLNQVFGFLGYPERAIVFSETAASAVVIEDDSLTDISTDITNTILMFDPTFNPGTAYVLGQLYGQARQANINDLPVLPSQTVIGQPNSDAYDYLVGLGVPAADAAQLSINGITYPLTDEWVLTETEVNMVITAQTAYNNSIAMLAAANDNVILVDVNAAMNQLANGGIFYDGGMITSEFVYGGGFSLDGVHPTARGYAVISNIILDRINEEFDATIPAVNPADYPSVYFGD
jgi:lysophospholipase L1-like esterase